MWTSDNRLVDLSAGRGSSVAAAINDKGSVVVHHQDDAWQQSYLWTLRGGKTDIGDLGGQHTVTSSINKNDELTGYSLTSSGEQRAVYWSAKTGLVNIGGPDSTGRAINDKGQVVGTERLAEQGEVGFVWSAIKGAAFLPAANNDPYMYVADINNHGDIVGAQGGTAYLWTTRA